MMKPLKYPVNAQAYERWRLRIIDQSETAQSMHNIPALMAMECWCLVKAYYGSTSRALWTLGKNALHLWAWGWYGSILIKISDRAGWTKMYHYNETEEMFAHDERHGRLCSGSPNCADMDCISRSIPKWFKRITRWHLYD